MFLMTSAGMEMNVPESMYESLAKLPENNPGPVFQMDTSGQILLANGKARQVLAEAELIGRNWMHTCPGFDADRWADVLKAQEPYKYETTIEECIFLFTLVRPQMGEYVYAYGNDVTEFRQAQQQLAEQAARMKEMARFPEMNPGPVFRIDSGGNILLANAAARQIFGEHIVGNNWTNVFPGMTVGKWMQILQSPDVLPFEAHFDACDYVFTHRSDPVSKLVFVYGSDITYQKKTERALLQAEKMATLGTLAAGVAHELNNPAAATKRAAEQLRDAVTQLEHAHTLLNASAFNPEARTALEMLEKLARDNSKQISALDPLTRADREAAVENWLVARGIPEPWHLAPHFVTLDLEPAQLDQLQAFFSDNLLPAVLKWMGGIYLVYVLLNEINQGSGRISEIVGALKNYSYLGQAPVQMVNLHEGIDNTLVILRSKTKKGITVHRDYGADVPPIFAYGSELNQVWTNLIDNAVDALNGQGEIRIRTFRDKDYAVVTIEDNGSGIPKNIQSRIFDPFFTTKPPGKGTGLGLSTTYGIVTEKHRGQISVESEPGHTRFTVRLPLKQLNTETRDS